MSGLFMLKRPVIEGAELKPTGYKILLEILIAGHFSKVTEVPYGFKVRERGESKLSSKTQIDYLKHLYSLMRRSGELERFIMRIAAGVSGMLVNLAIYWLLTRYPGLNRYLALVVGFEVSFMWDFLLVRLLASSDRRSGKTLPFARQFVKFNMISLVGLGLQAGSLWLFNSVIGIPDIAAVAIGIVIGTLCNFFLNSWFAWN
jgi:dolichol-phosphate mannosyltransferase